MKRYGSVMSPYYRTPFHSLPLSSFLSSLPLHKNISHQNQSAVTSPLFFTMWGSLPLCLSLSLHHTSRYAHTGASSPLCDLDRLALQGSLSLSLSVSLSLLRARSHSSLVWSLSCCFYGTILFSSPEDTKDVLGT